MKLLKLNHVFVTGEDRLGWEKAVAWVRLTRLHLSAFAIWLWSQTVQVGPHKKRKRKLWTWRKKKKRSVFLKDRRMKRAFLMRASHLACCRAPRGTHEHTINGAPDAKWHNEYKQSWDETCPHQKDTGLRCQRRRCWELEIWNHSRWFARNLQLKRRKKNFIIKRKNPDAAFPSLSCYQRWFIWARWFIFSFEAPFLTLTDKSEAPVGNARVWPSCSGSCCCDCW